MEDVTITAKEFDSLTRAAFFLDCLENSGVDNWDGWEYAMEEFQEEYPDGKRS